MVLNVRSAKRLPKAKEDKNKKNSQKPRTTIASYDGSVYPRKTQTLDFTIPILFADTITTPRPPPTIVPPKIASPRNQCLFKKPNTSVRGRQTSIKDIFRPLRLSSSSTSSTPRSSTTNSVPSHAASSPSSSSSAPDFSEIKASIQSLEIDLLRTASTKCPVCKEPVDCDFLQGFNGDGEHITVRQQMRFCEAHRIQSAKAQWEVKGYPNIDWNGFDQRLAHFHGALNDILQRKRASYYGNAFENHIKSGNRTLLQSMRSGSRMEGFELGYYGPRGAMLMNENIIAHFAPHLRRLAASDTLIHSNGIAGFVQAVLAPELAVMLVMQDFPGMDEEGARRVLMESNEVGMLLNDEMDEVIRDLPSGRRRAERRRQVAEMDMGVLLANDEEEEAIRDSPLSMRIETGAERCRGSEVLRESEESGMLSNDGDDEVVRDRLSMGPRSTEADTAPQVAKEDRESPYRSRSQRQSMAQRKESHNKPRPRRSDWEIDELAI